MTTLNAVRGWVETMINGSTNVKGRLRTNSCSASGYYFLSYDTPIAKYSCGKFEVATRKYSTTTSKLQTYLRGSIPSSMLVDVDEIKDNGEFPWRR